MQHYTIDLMVDMQDNFISGTVTISALATQDLSSFNLDFLGFEIAQISVNNQPVEYRRSEGELTITPTIPIANTSPFTVDINYSGIPGEGLPPGLAAYEAGWTNYGDGVMVAGEPSRASSWYPVNGHPLDKATYTFRITVAEPYVVAANGLLQEVVDNGDTNTYIWESGDPIASYLVTLGIAEFDRVTEIGPDGLLIRNYFATDIPSRTRDNFNRTAEMIEYFITVFGPYPFEAYGVIVHDMNLGFALETQTLSIFGNSFNQEPVVVHELAHMWFGDSVGLERWQDIWLNEGFASYASVLWIEHDQGEEAAASELGGYYEDMAFTEPSATFSRAEIADFVNDYPLDGSTLSAEQVSDALEALLGSSLSSADLESALDSIPSSGLPREQILSLIDEMSFRDVFLTLSRLNQFLTIIELEEFVEEVDYYNPPPGNPPADNLFSGSVYERGALTLHALRLEVGDEVFFEILRTYFSRFQNSNASTTDFIELAEEVSRENLEELFDAWLFEPTLPDIPEMGLYLEDYLP